MKVLLQCYIMPQINFKIPEKEQKFLKWYSDLHSEPISSIYSKATLEPFREWKISILISEYQKGAITFKQFCYLTSISFEEASLIFQNLDIEPPISSIIDEYTNEIRKGIDLKTYKKITD